MTPTQRKAALIRVGELRPEAEALHNSDLHETAAAATDLGDMTFCPGCEAHVILHKARDEVPNPAHRTPEDYVAAQQIRLDRLSTLTGGKTIVADDLKKPVPPGPPVFAQGRHP